MSQILKNIYVATRDRILAINIYLHLVIAIISFGLYGFTNSILDGFYASSKFPVPYYVGQTAFSGELIKEYYAFMMNAGTLGVYWQTQLIDFTFITSVILTGLFLPTFVARLHKDGTWLRTISFCFGVMFILGGVSDVIENLISFVMLAQPETFPNWIALIYSAFAVLKFGNMIPAMIGTFISLVLAMIVYVGSLLLSRFKL